MGKKECLIILGWLFLIKHHFVSSESVHFLLYELPVQTLTGKPLVVQWLQLPISTGSSGYNPISMGSIPSRGTKILHAAVQPKKKRKETKRT